MILGKVIGHVVATAKHPAYIGEKILMVQPIDPSHEPKGNIILAVDKVQAGSNDIVLVMTEGNSARQLLGTDETPVNMVIVGIVDEVENVE